jgi:ABC-type multidrug transport system ATPase subunit
MLYGQKKTVPKIHTYVSAEQNDEYCISERYNKDSIYTLKDISFDVKYGTVFGFLGPDSSK